MARKPRRKSSTGMYHVMLRGINRQQIFYDSEDNCYFLALLIKYKALSGFRLHAFCLMGNHVHLLLEVREQELGTVIQRISDAFVYWYNRKYNRSGHLFQERFKSEPIEDHRYFLTVLRYILGNPLKAGLCERMEQYEYSSGREYICPAPGAGITDKDLALSIMGENELIDFLLRDNDDQCLDLKPPGEKKIDDEEAKKMILKEFGTYYPSPGRPNTRSAFNHSVRRLTDSGITPRQLSRLTGVSRKIIMRAQ